MKFLNDLLLKLYPPVQPIQPGIFSYRPNIPGKFPYPMHLRIESDEDSLLILNASTVLHLNETAAEFLFHYIQGQTKDEIIRRMSKRYTTRKEILMADYEDLFERMTILMSNPDLDPVSFLDFDRDTPHSGFISAPYRLDMALTYRFDDGDTGNDDLKSRVKQELTKEQWLSLVDKSWEIGIPQLVFTGGEPTLIPFLPNLIARAESNGQVTGLLTNGKRISDKTYLKTLLDKGLDHMMIILDPDDERCWEAIQHVMPEDVFVTVHLTIEKNEASFYQTVLEKLKQAEVTSLSLSTNHSDHQETLSAVNESAMYLGFSLVWGVAVPYSTLNPASLEAELEGAALHTSNKTALYLEPDGDVLKAQGLTDVLGNLLADPWDEIWAKVD